MLKAILFDLDDTLYEEAEYVKQALEHTAGYLAGSMGAPERKEKYYQRMLELLDRNGRGRIFNDICEEIAESALSEKPSAAAAPPEGAPATLPAISELVQVYRSTKPKLKLYPDAEMLLRRLSEKRIKTGLITDGCSQVQHEKISALKLDERLDCVIATDDFGLSKPDTAVYRKCLEALGCEASEAAYVGDNPRKDFLGAKALGMKTFRIIRRNGMHMRDEAEPETEAEYRIHSLEELLEAE